MKFILIPKGKGLNLPFITKRLCYQCIQSILISIFNNLHWHMWNYKWLTIWTFKEWKPWWFTYASSWFIGAKIAILVQSINPIVSGNKFLKLSFTVVHSLAIVGNFTHRLSRMTFVALATRLTFLLIGDWLNGIKKAWPTARWYEPVA